VKTLLALVALVSLVGCGEHSATETPGAGCTDNAIPAITVTIVDALTSQPIPGGALVIARDGAYADTAAGQPPLYFMAYERSGTYSVSVASPGYRPWNLEGLVVMRDRCHVKTVPLAARLMVL